MRATPFPLLVALIVSGCGSSGGDSGSPAPDPGPDPEPTPVAGLDARPANATCLAPGIGGSGNADVELEDAFPDLPGFDRPVAFVQAPGDSSRWFVAEQRGRVQVFDNAPDVGGYTSFVDIQARVDDGPNEAGLLGLAFDPDFASSGEVYLSYTAPGLESRLSRFRSSDGGLTLDPGSEEILLRLNQDAGNHNGGGIAFGPDGLLYIGFGDGGGSGDPLGRAQDTSNLLGAMLRIDVSGGGSYSIPADNPFAANPVCPADHSGTAACPELYAWGLRNPWRWSFDRDTGDLWAGDVGQNAWEEVDVIARNGNYGWNCREGMHAYTSPGAACAGSEPGSFVEPVAEYGHDEGISITGGYVYRGAALPALFGRYVFADFVSRRVWALTADGAGGYTRAEIAQSSQGIASFGEDQAGELYVVGWSSGSDGRIRRLVPGPGAEPPDEPVAATLSATGCVVPDDPAAPADGLIPYDVAAPFWSDAAGKQRWLALPDGTTMSLGADGDFELPNGSVLMKHFRRGGRLIETRLLMRHGDGNWAGYSYEWDAAGSDADLLAGGKRVTIDGEPWIFPSRDECLGCHTAAAGFSLGLETAQLNHSLTYPRTGRSANQLVTLDALAMFDTPLADPAGAPALTDPADSGAGIDARARAYLHTNCAQCHRPGGTGGGALDLRFATPLPDSNACDAMPQHGDVGLGAAARIVAPGDPEASVLLERMRRRDDAAMMPPLASTAVDTAGAALIADWIASLPGC